MNEPDRMVEDSLDAAVANGYMDDCMRKPLTVAVDMCDYDFTFAEYTDRPEALVPFIKKWQAKQRRSA
jgi:hypothetical protein